MPQRATWGPRAQRGCERASTVPTPDTHASLFPLGPLPEQLFSERPKTRFRQIPGDQTWFALSRVRAKNLLAGAGGSTGLVSCSPNPLPTHSQSPPTLSRCFPFHRSARFWRPESRRGDRVHGGCRGSEGTLRTAAGEEGGEEIVSPAHLARQLFAPVDPRPREGFDPRHNPMPRSGRTPHGPRRPAIVGGGVQPTRFGLGDRKSDSPSPAPRASSSNPSLLPPAQEGGEAEQREGGVPTHGMGRPGLSWGSMEDRGPWTGLRGPSASFPSSAWGRPLDPMPMSSTFLKTHECQPRSPRQTPVSPFPFPLP